MRPCPCYRDREAGWLLGIAVQVVVGAARIQPWGQGFPHVARSCLCPLSLIGCVCSQPRVDQLGIGPGCSWVVCTAGAFLAASAVNASSAATEEVPLDTAQGGPGLSVDDTNGISGFRGNIFVFANNFNYQKVHYISHGPLVKATTADEAYHCSASKPASCLTNCRHCSGKN